MSVNVTYAPLSITLHEIVSRLSSEFVLSMCSTS